MKKIVAIIAACLVLDLVLVAALLVSAWHPLGRLTSLVLVRSGDRLEARRDYAGALERYDHALALDPSNVDAYAGRVYAQVHLGQYDAALADGEKAVLIDGLCGTAYGARGWAKEWKRDWEGARTDYDQAIKYSPTAAYYAHRGWSRFQEKEIDGALQDYTSALEMSPHLAFAYHDRALIKFREDDLRGALEDEGNAIEFSPHNVAYYLRRSDFRLCADDADGALADAKEALVFAPRAPGALYREGVALRRQGNIRDSIIVFDQLLQISPHYGGALFERAMSKYAAGDVASASEDLESNRVNAAERPMSELWLWVTNTEQGARAEADRQLGDYLADARNVKTGTWPEKIGAMLLGRTTADVLAASVPLSKNDRERREQVCELWFFAGKVAMLRGDKASGRTDFQKALDSCASDIVEFSEARRELAQR